MADNREKDQQREVIRSANDNDNDRTEQFNELSELSLEERMAVADKIGIPVYNMGEASATGAMSGNSEESYPNDGTEQEPQDKRPDR